MDPATTVDEFLAALPQAQRDALKGLQGVIRAAAPEATEQIAYGVPSFKFQGRPLVSFGAGKGHCAFYVQSPAVMEAFSGELKAYDTSKGTIRFPPDQPLPDELVQRLVKARVEENEARVSAQRRSSQR